MAKRVKAKYYGRTIYCTAAGFTYNGKKVQGQEQVPTGGLDLNDKTAEADINKLLAAGKIGNTNESTYDYLFEDVPATAAPVVPKN